MRDRESGGVYVSSVCVCARAGARVCCVAQRPFARRIVCACVVRLVSVRYTVVVDFVLRVRDFILIRFSAPVNLARPIGGSSGGHLRTETPTYLTRDGIT